nr:hypothetical protein GZ18F2_23 [uncultured archaeon GZfos18F2]
MCVVKTRMILGGDLSRYYICSRKKLINNISQLKIDPKTAFFYNKLILLNK